MSHNHELGLSGLSVLSGHYPRSLSKEEKVKIKILPRSISLMRVIW